MQKKFIGHVLKSELNEFTNTRGEVVTLWKLVVALNEERCVIFNVPSTNERLFHRVSACEEGEQVSCIAEPVGKNDGRIRYALISLDENLEEPSLDSPYAPTAPEA